MSHPYKIIIVEDEVFIAEHLCDLLQEYGFEIVANCNTYAEGVAALNNIEYDIAVLDINLNEQNLSGLDLAQLCKAQEKPFLFLTAYSDTATINSAAELQPDAYIIKPILGSALFAAIQVALSHHLKSDTKDEELDYVFIKVGSNNIKVNWHDVEAITHEKNYVRLRSSKFQTQGYLIRASLSSALQSIIPRQMRNSFVQVSRTTIANLKYINAYSDKVLKLPCGSFEIGDSYASGLHAAVVKL
jgi:DNA-binding response OmpR family regulator